MHWFGKEHLESEPNLWGQWNEKAGGPTMIESLLWLRNIEGLGLRQESFADWLVPSVPDWCLEDDDEMME